MARQLNKTKLSKSILEMKFMQRTKEKVLQEQEDEEGRAMYSNEITDKMRQGGTQYIIEQSFIPCEDLIVGRVSYRGMNPEIERLLELEEEARNQIIDVKNETVMSDKEMAQHYNVAVGTMAKRFEGKSNRNRQSNNYKPYNKHNKFIKPDN